MRNIWTIARKELGAYFASPVGYTVLAIFGFIFGWMYFSSVAIFVEYSGRAQMGAQGMPPETVSSMYHDLLAGKRIELEALHGHASRLGERHGIPTPATSAVYAALLPHVAGARR